jgi:putative spermidine/putrescine transport system permease protein
MLVKLQTTGESSFTRPSPGRRILFVFLAPALIVVLLLFGGGLLLGLLQGLGYFPGAEEQSFTLRHFSTILGDRDFLKSLGLTLYVSLTSTVIAVVLSIVIALVFLTLSERQRWVHFIFQIPLVVPHLVVAIAVVFLLSPTGWLSRLAQAGGLINGSADFPLFVNDRFGIGIIVTYIWKEVPFITLMIFSVLRNAGIELIEVGKTLNANRWQRFRYIIFPIISPSLAASGLIVFAYTFGAFEIPFLLGQTYPMLLPVWAYKNYADVDLLARPEGIATGIVIASIVALSVLVSHIVGRSAQQRSGIK